MGLDDATAIAAQLMPAFASRTGLYPASENQQRYLWTDAFAVCNFLELLKRTGDDHYRRCATDLIVQVHQVLGRYRPDDVRRGWISGLDEETGQRHPTKRGAVPNNVAHRPPALGPRPTIAVSRIRHNGARRQPRADMLVASILSTDLLATCSDTFYL
jgi:hypothetical protein